jgi:hypothetical protein
MKCLLQTLVVGVVVLPAWNSFSKATLFVPGSYQTENGGGSDWDPPTAPAMTESPPASGTYSLNLVGLAGAGAGSSFEFKILDDEGTPPANWGDPELTPGPNSWFLTDAGGNASISIDTNTASDGFAPSTNRVTVSTDAAEIAGFYPTGNWMDEAGGAGDWNPGDPMFQMSHLGDGLWATDVTISTVGNYEWKATKGDFGGQWGTDGRNVNASTWIFSTTKPDEQVRFVLDIGKGAISLQIIPEPVTALLAGWAMCALTGLVRCRK